MEKTHLAVEVAIRHCKKGYSVLVFVADEERRLEFIKKIGSLFGSIIVAVAGAIILSDYDLIIVDDADQIKPEAFYKHIVPILQTRHTRLLVLWSPLWVEGLGDPVFKTIDITI